MSACYFEVCSIDSVDPSHCKFQVWCFKFGSGVIVCQKEVKFRHSYVWRICVLLDTTLLLL